MATLSILEFEKKYTWIFVYFSLFFQIFLNILEHSKEIKKKKRKQILENYRKS